MMALSNPLFDTGIVNGLFLEHTSFLKRFSIKASPTSTWNWRGNDIRCISFVSSNTRPNIEHNDRPAMLFIHGFGSSLYHWRGNLREMSQYCDVYAIDLVGFGNSSKPAENYNINLWSCQVRDFVNTQIKRETILVGNSLGGFISLECVNNPYVKGIVAINNYANLKPKRQVASSPTFLERTLVNCLVRAYFGFFKTKMMIETILAEIYPTYPEKIDGDLIESIYDAASHPNAQNVLKSIVMNMIYDNKALLSTQMQLAERLQKPVFVIWGEHDTWLDPEIPKQMIHNYTNVQSKYVNAGHCPQDEIPVVVNALLVYFLRQFNVSDYGINTMNEL